MSCLFWCEHIDIKPFDVHRGITQCIQPIPEKSLRKRESESISLVDLLENDLKPCFDPWLVTEAISLVAWLSV